MIVLTIIFAFVGSLLGIVLFSGFLIYAMGFIANANKGKFSIDKFFDWCNEKGNKHGRRFGGLE